MQFQSRDMLKRLEAPGGRPILKAYPDQGGIWTVGWGHTRHVQAGLVATPEQCEAWLDDDLRGIEYAITSRVTTPLTQNQYDALVIWEFNTGALLTSKSLLKLLNSGKLDEACALMQRYKYVTIKGKKVVSNGLVKRRSAEAFLWNTQVHDPSTPPVTGEVPVPPPENVSHTTTGKLQIGALITGAFGAITSYATALQPVVDAVKQAFGWAAGLEGYQHDAVLLFVGLSMTFTVATIVYKQYTTSQGAL